jgi:hypothetical protein
LPVLFLSSCNSNDKEADKTADKTPKIKEETVSYKVDTPI